MTEDRVIGSQFGKPQVRRRTPGSWTDDKEDRFLLELGMTCNVMASARVVGMSARSAYDRRAGYPSFRAAWAVAVTEGYERLELCLLERAIGGKRKPVWYLGNRVGSVRDYIGNPVAQRAVRLVSEGVGSAPVSASDPAALALVVAKSGGQSLVETMAMQLLLHGNAYVQVLADADGKLPDAEREA